jgi:hypothetical protein
MKDQPAVDLEQPASLVDSPEQDRREAPQAAKDGAIGDSDVYEPARQAPATASVSARVELRKDIESLHLQVVA